MDLVVALMVFVVAAGLLYLCALLLQVMYGGWKARRERERLKRYARMPERIEKLQSHICR